jgi:hypothetical protein
MTQQQRPRVRVRKPQRAQSTPHTIPGDFDRGYALGACVVSSFYGWIASKLWRLLHPIARLLMTAIGFVVGMVWFAFMLGTVCWIAEHLVRKYNR